MDLAQFYETTILNREGGGHITFATVPARSFPEGVPEAGALAGPLEVQDSRIIRPVEAWNLPFVLDALMGRYPDFPWILEVAGPGMPRQGRGPSPFAQYLAYAPVVPFESSPLGGKSLSELVTTAGVGTGAVVGVFAIEEPIVLLSVPAGIILCRAAHHVGDGIGIGLRNRILALLGVDPPPADDPPA